MKESVDVTIIGAGVVGLAIAETVAAKNRQVVVLEKNESFGQETRSRNSEVIHAGIYYPKDFLKSRRYLLIISIHHLWETPLLNIYRRQESLVELPLL